jgi:hypothetical protein
MKKSFIVAGVSLLGFIILSSDVFAQSSISSGISSLSSLVNTFTTTLVKSLGTLFMSMAVVAFFYGVVQYIWGAREGKADKIAAGNQFMIWGLVGLFVMFSVYGIITFFGNAIGIQQGGTIIIPDIQLKGSASSGGSQGASNNSGVSVQNPLGAGANGGTSVVGTGGSGNPCNQYGCSTTNSNSYPGSGSGNPATDYNQSPTNNANTGAGTGNPATDYNQSPTNNANTGAGTGNPATDYNQSPSNNAGGSLQRGNICNIDNDQCSKGLKCYYDFGISDFTCQ